MYRVVCTFHPNVAVFAKQGVRKGVWRVHACFPPPENTRAYVERFPVSAAPRVGILTVPSVRLRQVGSWCNPHKLLKEYLTQRWQAYVEQGAA